MLEPSSSELQQTNIVHTCDICGKVYHHRENLSRHKREHDDERSHKCKACGKSFNRSDLLRRHERLHESSNLVQSARPNRQSHTTTNPTVSLSENRNEIVARQVPFIVSASETLRQAVQAAPETVHTNATVVDNSTHQAWNLPAPTLTQTWLDQIFQSAVDEIGDDWQGHYSSWLENDFLRPVPLITTAESSSLLDGHETLLTSRHSHTPDVLSRDPSPPNEASEEDGWPYTWNPRSRKLRYSGTLTVSMNDNVRNHHRSAYDISAARYEKLKNFLETSNFPKPGDGPIPMPDLEVANILISCFFDCFEPQLPVIHIPSLDSIDQLCDPLLAIMVAIGSTYSGLEHSRRFAIALTDVTRLKILISLEADNALMRDTMTIYAAALTAFAGMWCGNKRAFEFTEIFKGTLVSLCRRNHFTGSSPIEHQTSMSEDKLNDTENWQAWGRKESQKRLCWVVYSFDCQLATLVNLSTTISLAEVCDIECPCDEEFWHAPNARRWKQLLGSASVPPSRTFASALSPFLKPIVYPTKTKRREKRRAFGLPIGANSWTRFLLLQTLAVHIYELSQQIAVARSSGISNSEIEFADALTQRADTMTTPISQSSADSASWGVQYQEMLSWCVPPTGQTRDTAMVDTAVCESLAKRKRQLQDAVSAWYEAYANAPPVDVSVYPSSQHFHHVSQKLYRVAEFCLTIPLRDLQDALGKSGNAQIPRAMSQLRQYTVENFEASKSQFLSCITFVSNEDLHGITADDKSTADDADPHDIVYVFLCYIFIWMWICSTDEAKKLGMAQQIQIEPAIRSLEWKSTVLRALECSAPPIDISSMHVPKPSDLDKEHTDRQSVPIQMVLLYGAKSLSRMGPWGACLDLANLVLQRSKM